MDGWEELDFDDLTFKVVVYSIAFFSQTVSDTCWFSLQNDVCSPCRKIIFGNSLRQCSDHSENLFIMVS